MILRFVCPILAGVFCQSALAESSPLKLGAKIPRISSLDQNGKSYDLAKTANSRWTLVYFYPKADTPGCTKQACSLRDTYEALLESGVTVIGVSKDSVSDQKKFEEKYNLPFTLLADKKAAVIKAFGVTQVPALGFARRQAFLFKNGVLVWRDLKASTSDQAKDVLAQISK